jgi:hypothetical protein
VTDAKVGSSRGNEFEHEIEKSRFAMSWLFHELAFLFRLLFRGLFDR